MKILNPDINLELFYQQRREASQKALLLDYDGTLAPFHLEPNRAEPYPGIREVLNKIMQVVDTRLVIISGRWTRDLLPLLQLEKQPEIWGSHGLERLQADGSYEIVSIEQEALSGLVAADEWIEEIGLSGRCEKKPGCLALHWRGLDEGKVKEIRNQVEPRWSTLAQASKLSLRGFDGGLELRVEARNKGDAVRTILQEMSQDAVAAYLGDDLTDEDAFRAIKGKGISILVREQLRQTAADLWLKPPEELLTFLSAWIPE
jgi:trehalose 6-phosphate phosphatase